MQLFLHKIKKLAKCGLGKQRGITLNKKLYGA